MKTTRQNIARPVVSFRPLGMGLAIALAFGFVVGGFPLAALAQQYVPPNRGLPGRREGGGTRGCWSNTAVPTTANRLTALVPAQNFGYTLDEYPSFFVYVPPFYGQKAVGAEFILVDDQDNEIYRATYVTANISGVISLSLPDQANLPPLDVGKDYNWSFSLICDFDDPSGNLVVDSWIQRIEPTPELASALQTATPMELPNLYAQSGIWYNAIASLNDLATLNSRTTLARWQSLLNSVGLDHIAGELSGESLTSRLIDPAASDHP